MSFAQNIKKYFLPLLFVAVALITVFKPDSDNLQAIAAKIQTQLSENEAAFNVAFQDRALIHELQRANYQGTIIESFRKKKIVLQYFRGDSLVYWSNSSIDPFPTHLTSNETSFFKQKNGWYQIMKWNDTSTRESVIALFAVKYAYPFENKFLQNDFAFSFHVPHNIELSDQKIEGSIPIHNLRGETLFSLYVSATENGSDINYVLLIAQILLLFIAFYYLHFFASQIALQKGFLLGFVLLVSTVLFVRGVMLWFMLLGEAGKLELFDPKYYASTFINPSLGDLVINTLLLLWLTGFYIHRKKLSLKSDTSLLNNLSKAGFIFLFTAYITWVFKTLVMDSVISFEVYNILSLDLYSLLGLICVALLFIIHFIITRRVVVSFSVKNWPIILYFLVGLTLIIVLAAYLLDNAFLSVVLVSTVWTVVFVAVMYLLLRKNKDISIQHIIIYVALYSVLATYLIENLYERRERNQRVFFSGKLVDERDYVAEYLFSDVASRIGKDGFIKNSFSNPIISQKEVTDRIGSLYLGGYFNKYDLKVQWMDGTGNSLRNSDTATINTIKNLLVPDSLQPNILQYISDTALNYSYISEIPIQKDSLISGFLLLRLFPKVYYGQNVYPELLLGNNVTVSNNVNNYSYAIYQNDKLVAQYGDYPYTYYWNREYVFSNDNLRFIEEPEWELNIQRFKNGKKVIVSIAREPNFEPVATFSYLFTFLFIVSVFIWLAFTLILGDWEFLFQGFAVSFRTRINYSMFLMILVSFIIIGFITISFFSRQYDNFYTDRLLRKEKVVHASLEYFIQQKSVDEKYLSQTPSDLEFEVARLAEINSIDINLFDKNGDLLVASQPAIYDKGLVSNRMNPDAYFDLERNKTQQSTKNETIGSLQYLATYAPIRNKVGESVGYIGIPYFERSKNISDEVSSFLVALMNVYVFLLICAALLAFFISNSITRPLTIISEKLRILNLNKKNEPIEWNSKDEIGILVSEYNKMISELEQSAQKLAKGERESAWREMAKQIAHEIKNPLTPMKLSIQYLQRAIDEGNPNIEQLAQKVTKTLDEQIENLSSIATAFSSFAKMPKAQNEIINLNELLKSITDLFNREEGATITFVSRVDSPFVFADKNQLVSVFNNLIKNAIQSIPEGRAGFVEVQVIQEDGWVITSVKDNGIGISPDNYDRVFVPNFTTKSSGTGLGLAITKQIIDGAGGSIWFESVENTGTTFKVKLKKNEPA
ncbi:MAG: HAMP domain-containing sensor histidine kinase [Chitinophagales bacterium]